MPSRSLIRGCLLLAIGLSGLLIANPARAAIIEEVVKLPVTVNTLSGQAVTREVVVTIFRDESRAKSPFLILNHGRSGVESERRGMGRAVYRKQAEWFVVQGFAVFVPTRIGYGATGGEDAENTGSCTMKNYPAGLVAAVEQIKAVARYAQTTSYVTTHRGVIAGQSVGGISTIAAPVFNDRHQVVAAVSLTVPAQQIEADQARSLVQLVQQAAAQVTQRISHLPQRSG